METQGDSRKMAVGLTRLDPKMSHPRKKATDGDTDRANSVAGSNGWIQLTKIMWRRSLVRSRSDPMIGSDTGAGEMHAEAFVGLSLGTNFFRLLTVAACRLALGRCGCGPY